mmetsp:Transcript_47026/g.54923  ORF Transcript_47026/g.54923 Transcript_47026/m.54923 type:complete len:800 (-) Transcript_47026:208-2607(-)
MVFLGKKKPIANVKKSKHAAYDGPEHNETLHIRETFEDSNDQSESDQASNKSIDKQNLEKMASKVEDNTLSSKWNALTPSMVMMPELISDISKACETSDTSCANAEKALQFLFTLSENITAQQQRVGVPNGSSSSISKNENPSRVTRNKVTRNNREDMVFNYKSSEGNFLVPTLMKFLVETERDSKERYLVLLVLNNLSIPLANKRYMALECEGIQILNRCLTLDLSCHLIAIILVNLTFGDDDLRRDLVDPDSNIQLVDALAYAIGVSSSPSDDGDYSVFINPSDQTLPARSLANRIDMTGAWLEEVIFEPSYLMYPDTAKWCLCALRNLTLSFDEQNAAFVINTNLVPLILRILEVQAKTEGASKSSGVAQKSVSQMRNIATNSPSTWDLNSIQDAALSIILNLSATEMCREYLRQEDAVERLLLIAHCDFLCDASNDMMGRQKFQSLKAKIALSFLVESEGHRSHPGSSNFKSVILMDSEGIHLLLELLVNTLHHRSKPGPGGYSAASFTLKEALYALRCMINDDKNFKAFSESCGIKLSSILFKVLALYSVQQVRKMDEIAAEHACFSLYLLSNIGFSSPFLPASFNDDEISNGIIMKVLTMYLRSENLTSTGRHLAQQLMLRVPHLVYSGSLNDTDYELGKDIRDIIGDVTVKARRKGTKPNSNIFDRPIYRSSPIKHANDGVSTSQEGNEFPSALHAMYEISSIAMDTRRNDAIQIDEILIANDIANSADGGKAESYNFCWSWHPYNKNNIKNQETKKANVKSIFQRAGAIISPSKNLDEPFTFSLFKCTSPT